LKPDLKVSVSVEARVSPSEDPQKVAAAVEGALGGFEHTVEAGRHSVRAESSGSGSLDRIRDQLRDRHVRSAARRLLLSSKKGRSTVLMLNRQAATAGVLALCSSEDQSPLGPLYLTIESEDIDGVIDWLTGQGSG
jgi:uncharacterized protein